MVRVQGSPLHSLLLLEMMLDNGILYFTLLNEMGSWSSDPGTCKSVRIFWDTPGSAHKDGDKTADFTFFWKTSEVAAATGVPRWGEEREFRCIYSICQVCAKLKRSFSCFDHGFHPGFFQGCPDPLWSRSCPVLGSG